MEGLALNLFDQGNYEDSVKLMREAVAMQRKLHDGPHPDLAEAINNLGWMLDEIGQYQEAEQLYREALEMKQSPAGRCPPGDRHRAQQRGVRALRRRASTTRPRPCTSTRSRCSASSSGVDHPDVALALNNLAFLAHDKGDLNTAVKMSRDSLEMYRRTLGNEHPDVAQGDEQPRRCG